MSRKYFLLIVFFTLFMLPVSIAHALKVAVMPVEDLSRGRNGVNFAVTEFLQQELAQKGFEVVSSDQVISFMAKKRIRWLGFLSSVNMYELRDELGVDFVLLATVSQNQEKPTSAFGLVLSLIQASDAVTVWSQSGAVSCADICNFLGLNEPETVDALLSVLVPDLLESLPLSFVSRGQFSPLTVESVKLFPRHVRPGEKVSCSVRFSGTDNEKNIPLLMVGDDDYLPMIQQVSGIYQASWFAPDRNVSIPVTLITEGDGGGRQVLYLGSYQVDNSPPKVELKLVAKELEGEVVFNDFLLILPLWQEYEPVSHWKVEVRNMADEIIMEDDGKGDLPQHLAWKGQRRDGYKAPDSTYQIVLKVWDLAGNHTEAGRTVLLKASPPPVHLALSVDGGDFILTIASPGEFPLDYWSAELLYEDGEVIINQQGKDLPASVRMPVPSETELRKIEAVVLIQDVLGNKGMKKMKDIMKLVLPDEMEEEIVRQDEWVEGF